LLIHAKAVHPVPRRLGLVLRLSVVAAAQAPAPVRTIIATTHERPVVRIDNLNDPYWVTLLVAARRVKP
jgi:hypothetical protein